MIIIYYFLVIFYIICLSIHLSLYIGIFLFDKYYIFFNIICNSINPLIIIIFLIIVFKLIRDGIERPAMLTAVNEYSEFKRVFPNTDMKKNKMVLNIMNSYFLICVGLTILLHWIKNHPEYFNEKINELLQEQSIRYRYIERILASAWWFLFLFVPVIYFNDRSKQKKYKR
jgi:hypothetical protein